MLEAKTGTTVRLQDRFNRDNPLRKIDKLQLSWIFPKQVRPIGSMIRSWDEEEDQVDKDRTSKLSSAAVEHDQLTMSQ